MLLIFLNPVNAYNRAHTHKEFPVSVAPDDAVALPGGDVSRDVRVLKCRG